MPSPATTVADYLAALPPDRRTALEAVRQAVLARLPAGYEEGMQYGMIGYFVPHALYPAGYHSDPKQPLPYAALAAQKNHLSLYLMGVYGAPEHEAWLRDAWAAAGHTLDMGKSCVRFKGLADVPLDVVTEVVARIPAADFVARYAALDPRTEAAKAKAAAANAGAHAAAPRRPGPSTARAAEGAARAPEAKVATKAKPASKATKPASKATKAKAATTAKAATETKAQTAAKPKTTAATKATQAKAATPAKTATQAKAATQAKTARRTKPPPRA